MFKVDQHYKKSDEKGRKFQACGFALNEEVFLLVFVRRR